MRKYIILSLLGLLFSSGVYLAVNFIPGYLYNKIVTNDLVNQWFYMDRYSPIYLKPHKAEPLTPFKVENEFLWRKFNFSDLSISLPYKNPFYILVPNLKVVNDKVFMSLRLVNSQSDTVAEVSFLPKRNYREYLNSQPLFELPLVKNAVYTKSNDEIWDDIFSKEISLLPKNFQEAFYNLYILYLRSQYIPSGATKFNVVESKDLNVITLNSADKDYNSELFQAKRGKEIYSLIITTLKENKDAQVIRYKILNELSFLESSKALVDIIIKEFKGLNYNDQVDHSGMTYLLSALSYDLENQGILKNLIFYLERGSRNKKQLQALYEYYYEKYGEVFSKKEIDGIELSFEAMLKRNISLENEKKLKEKKVKKTRFKPTVKRNLNNEFDDLINNIGVKQNKNTISID